MRARASLLRVPLRPGSVRGAGRLRAAAADLRAAAGVAPGCGAARLLWAGAPVRAGFLTGLFQVEPPRPTRPTAPRQDTSCFTLLFCPGLAGIEDLWSERGGQTGWKHTPKMDASKKNVKIVKSVKTFL